MLGLLADGWTPEAEARLARILARELGLIWRLLRRLGVEASRVDDEVQRVFLIAAGKLSDLSEGKERSFLVGTAIRVAANARRSQATRQELLPADELATVSGLAPSPEELLDEKRRRELLDGILAELSLEQRSVFVLSELEHLSREEIAAHLGVPVGTVASRLRLARQHFLRLVGRMQAQMRALEQRSGR